MKPAFWARRAHKWIALFIGAQALLWTVSGLYMTVMSIDYIHGDHLAHSKAPALARDAALIDPGAISKRYPGMDGFRLRQLLGREVYEVRQSASIALVDARTGATIGPIDKPAARQLAMATYQGEAKLQSLQLIDKAPREVASREVPMWQATFGDRINTALYFSPQTGELLATRHDFWRLFDFLWMLHIMDYEDRTNVHNPLFRVVASVGFLFALSGVWLLFYSFRKRAAA
ncbi:PepSY domain-containing protein [Luteimonas mephitis]|uniref:PepSY domain-containing protein n=1 Tax=Luteimonas mephitis TaxID=83615 RepID=UPI0003F84C28|nr:PepSY domain-containing protein [Luteimonas mephitis]